MSDHPQEQRPLSEWTEAELHREYDAANYFANASNQAREVRDAEAMVEKIELEWDRRAAAEKAKDAK